MMHRLGMEQRSNLKITGVVKVDSFDEDEVMVDTEEGAMSIKGKGLHVSRLTLEKGEADIEGKINSIVYLEKNMSSKKGEGILKHLFS